MMAHNSPLDYLAALQHIPVDGLGDDWVRVSAAAKVAGVSYTDWHDWTSVSTGYKGEADARARWKSFKVDGGGAGAGTLIHIAKEHGWKPVAPSTAPVRPVRVPTPPSPNPPVLHQKEGISPLVQSAAAPKPQNPIYDLLSIWERAGPATAKHPYCVAKGVNDGPALNALRVLPDSDRLKLKGHSMAGALLIPLRLPNGSLQSLQCIAKISSKPDGTPEFDKPNLKGCSMEDAFHIVGQGQAGQPIYIVEGIGAAWAVWQATECAAVVTFGVGRTDKVASTVLKQFPDSQIVLVPDVGQEQAAHKVAKKLGCAVVLMDDGEASEWEKNSDVWDYLTAHGTEGLADLLATATKPKSKAQPTPVACGGLIPAENDRPKYVVFDDWYEAPSGEKLQPGVWHFTMKHVGKGDNATVEPAQLWVCSPLRVEAITADAYDGSYGRMLRFKNTRGNWRTWAMPMEMLASDCNELRAVLLSMGVTLNPVARIDLPLYLQRQYPTDNVQCVLQPGWSDSKCRAFVLPDTVIGPAAAGVVYQSETKGDTDYGTAGTLEGWQSNISAMAIDNPMLALAICTAFAGPLLYKCNAESGGPHFIGPSSTGKSSAMAAAVSVWGSPTYKRGWRATSNGLEAVATMFNDGLLALDELGECNPNDVGAVVYMIGNGQGKQRASRSGGFRHLARWRCSVLSNGEYSIGTSMAEGGHRIKAGQEVRIFDVPCADRPHGVWDTLHHYPDSRAFSDGIKNEAKAHYGTAGRAFLERLAAETEDLGSLLAAIRARPEFTTNGEGQEQRVAGRFAILAMAGELATEYGITGWPEGEAIKAGGEGLQAWRSLQADKDGANRERGQIVQAITDFIDRHGDSRFSDADAVPDTSQQRQTIIHNRAGYWRTTTERGRVYLFNSVGMREALKGKDFGRAITYLQEAGLMPSSGKDGKTQMQHKVQGKNARWYEVRPYGGEGVI